MWTLRTDNTEAHGLSISDIVETARTAIRERGGELWIEYADDGPFLGIVVGDSGRAMVLRIAESGDAGYHAVVAAATDAALADQLPVRR